MLAMIQHRWPTLVLVGKRTTFQCKSKLQFLLIDNFDNSLLTSLFVCFSILKFVNWQSDGIKKANSANLVTVGSWSEHAQTSAYSESSRFHLENISFILTLGFYDLRELLHRRLFEQCWW